MDEATGDGYRVVGSTAPRRAWHRRLARGIGACGFVLLVLHVLPPRAAAQELWSWPAPVGVLAGAEVSGGACPSISQCTVVDASGRETTFNPLSPGHPTPIQLDTQGRLESIACPAVSQCTATAVSSSYRGLATPGEIDAEVTFDPQSPGSPPVQVIDAYVTASSSSFNLAVYTLSAIACPSVTQCTAVDYHGGEVTFNPQSPGTPTPVVLGTSLSTITCPAVTQCTTVQSSDGRDGAALTFNPQSSQPAAVTAVSHGVNLDKLSCPSLTQCTDAAGLTFNPQAAGSPTSKVILPSSHGSGPDLGYAVSCPSVSFCVLAGDDIAQGDPNHSSSWTVTSRPGNTLFGDVACLSDTQCVAMDSDGGSIVGSPAAHGALTAQRARVKGTTVSLPVSCAGSATQLCRARLTMRTTEVFKGGKARQRGATHRDSGNRIVRHAWRHPPNDHDQVEPNRCPTPARLRRLGIHVLYACSHRASRAARRKLLDADRPTSRSSVTRPGTTDHRLRRRPAVIRSA